MTPNEIQKVVSDAVALQMSINETQLKRVIHDALREEFGAFVSTATQVTFPKSLTVLAPNGINGSLGAAGGTAGVFGVTTTRAAAIAAPTAPGAAYVQAEAASAVAAINSIRTALSNFGITL